jgi:hypothetical protein
VTYEHSTNTSLHAVAAHPLTLEKLETLMAYLDAKLVKAVPGSYEALIILRDIAYFAYLWESLQRGGEGARLAYSDVTQFKEKLRVSPNKVKNCQHRRCGELEIYPQELGSTVCFPTRLDFLTAAMAASGYSVTGDAPVFRMSSGRKFTSESMTYGAVSEIVVSFRS